MKNSYLERYETTLAGIRAEENNLNRLTIQKRQLQQNATTTDQIVAVEAQITSTAGRLSQLRSQSREYATQLQELSRQDTQLLEALSSIEAEYKQIVAQTHKYGQAYKDILVILNGYSEKEGLELNQTEFITTILPPEELVRSDVLKNACELNHKEEFDRALERVTDINFQDQEGKTILMHAIINGFYYGVNKLLARGADVNLLDNKGANALIYSATMPHICYTEAIAQRTDDINHKANQDFHDGASALHLLIANTNTIWFGDETLEGSSKDSITSSVKSEAFELKVGNNGNNITVYGDITLLEVGERIRIQAEGLDMRIGVPEAGGHSKNQEKVLIITQQLTNLGANINCQNSKGMTPFFLACDYGLTYLAHTLLESYRDTIDFSLKDMYGNTYLHYSATLPHSTDIIQSMLTNIEVNTQNVAGGTAILQAVIRNNTESLQFLIANGANIDILDIDGRHPWHYASQHGALEAMQIIKSGNPDIVDLRTSNAVGATALHTSSEHNKTAIVSWLVDQGADVNARTIKQGFTPFFIACIKKNVAIAEYLFNHPNFDNSVIDNNGYGSLHWVLEFRNIAWIEKVLNKGGIGINMQDIEGHTTLAWAAAYNLPEIISFLLTKGADPFVPNKLGGLAIHSAAANGALEAIKVLIQTGDIDQLSVGQHKVTPMWEAAKKGKLDTVKWFIKNHANINAANSYDGTTITQIAIIKGHDVVARTLIDAGADIDTARADGNNAFTLSRLLSQLDGQPFNEDMKDLAIYILSIMSREQLINCGGNRNALSLVTNLNSLEALEILKQKLGVIEIDERSLDGHTAANLAVYHRHHESLEWLKAHGADIDSPDSNGLTCLHHLSLRVGQIAQLRFALDHGASPNIQAVDGLTPFFLVCKAIKSTQPGEEKTRVVSQVKPTLLALLEANPDMTLTDSTEFGYFHWALETRDQQVLHSVLAHGGNIDARDSSGMTPLHWAVKHGYPDIVQWLVQHGASINVGNNDMETPLHICLSGQAVHDIIMIKTLVALGADPTAENSVGQTPIELARQSCEVALTWLEHPENIEHLITDCGLVGDLVVESDSYL